MNKDLNHPKEYPDQTGKYWELFNHLATEHGITLLDSEMDQIKIICDTLNQPDERECICEGNWISIIKESEPLFDKLFIDTKGSAHRFIGVIHGSDDYYYCMMSMTGHLSRLSCVGNISDHGFKLIESNNP